MCCVGNGYFGPVMVAYAIELGMANMAVCNGNGPTGTAVPGPVLSWDNGLHGKKGG